MSRRCLITVQIQIGPKFELCILFHEIQPDTARTNHVAHRNKIHIKQFCVVENNIFVRLFLYSCFAFIFLKTNLFDLLDLTVRASCSFPGDITLPIGVDSILTNWCPRTWNHPWKSKNKVPNKTSQKMKIAHASAWELIKSWYCAACRITAPSHTATLQHTLQHTHKCARVDKLNKRNTRVQKDCRALPDMAFAELFLKKWLVFLIMH